MVNNADIYILEVKVCYKRYDEHYYYRKYHNHFWHERIPEKLLEFLFQ